MRCSQASCSTRLQRGRPFQAFLCASRCSLPRIYSARESTCLRSRAPLHSRLPSWRPSPRRHQSLTTCPSTCRIPLRPPRSPPTQDTARGCPFSASSRRLLRASHRRNRTERVSRGLVRSLFLRPRFSSRLLRDLSLLLLPPPLPPLPPPHHRKKRRRCSLLEMEKNCNCRMLEWTSSS